MIPLSTHEKALGFNFKREDGRLSVDGIEWVLPEFAAAVARGDILAAPDDLLKKAVLHDALQKSADELNARTKHIIEENWDKDTMNVLQEADKLTAGEKQEDYGNAYTCCKRIADVWSAILQIQVTPEQVCLCMTGLKLIREANKSKRDNIVDIAGYARVLEMVKNAQIK